MFLIIDFVPGSKPLNMAILLLTTSPFPCLPNSSTALLFLYLMSIPGVPGCKFDKSTLYLAALSYLSLVAICTNNPKFFIVSLSLESISSVIYLS